MSSQVLHNWYVEPLDAHTNEVLAKNQEFLSEEPVLHDVRCGDGKTHRLYVCKNYSNVNELRNSRMELRLKFTVWHQQGQGQIREWIFPKKRVTFNKLVRKMRVPKPVNEKP